jgi:hypothetical protein
LAEIEYLKAIADEKLRASYAAEAWLKEWLTRLGPDEKSVQL